MELLLSIFVSKIRFIMNQILDSYASYCLMSAVKIVNNAMEVFAQNVMTIILCTKDNAYHLQIALPANLLQVLLAMIAIAHAKRALE